MIQKKQGIKVEFLKGIKGSYLYLILVINILFIFKPYGQI